MVRANLNPGQVVEVEARYTFTALTFDADALNSVTWRTPTITSVLWSHP